MLEPITITANGRNLSFVGTSPTYLKWYSGWTAEVGTVYKSAKDLPQGSVCIDAGANIGIMAITLAVQRPDFHIIACEPVPSNVECLRRNVEANGIKNVEVVEAALSDRHRTVSLTDGGPWSLVCDDETVGAIKAHTLPDMARPSLIVSARCIPLDDFVDRNVAFVKIDCEGYEPYVLAGGRKLFARWKSLVHMEWNTWCLLLQRVDPLTFAKAVWQSFDVLGTYHEGNLKPPPKDDLSIVMDNITAYGSVSDLLMRPKAEMPPLEEMIYSPQMAALLKQHPIGR